MSLGSRLHVLVVIPLLLVTVLIGVITAAALSSNARRLQSALLIEGKANQVYALLLVQEVMRANLPIVRNTDDLATVLNQFSAHDVSRLPVGLPGNTSRVIGLISRAALMRRYQEALARD